MLGSSGRKSLLLGDRDRKHDFSAGILLANPAGVHAGILSLHVYILIFGIVYIYFVDVGF